MKKSALVTAILFVSTLSCWGQSRGLRPIFPEKNPNIISIEGEAAVSTNFAMEPTWNYHASGSRTLQLNRAVGLQGNSPFFAEYVFYVEQGGEFLFWYGGTPPGPKDDLYPSYTSPFSYSIDDGAPVQVYSENAAVRERYLPSLYWCETGTLRLEKGIHKIRIEVGEKRKYDGRYLFYIDNLFFLRKSAAHDPGEPRPEIFPKLPAGDRDIQFQSIGTYEQDVRAHPEDPEKYKELSLMYSLIGDYINALKTIKQAQLLAPDNMEYTLLAAKNRIWKGDSREGLALYRQAADKNPEDPGIWAEGGKIAAWTGNYQESINFYTEGLKHHPDNLGLTVNLGITYLWMSKDSEAEQYFEKASSLAEKDPAKVKELATVFIINGYKDRAEEIYRRGVNSFPDHLDFYLQLQDLYTSEGKDQDAEKVLKTITETFIPSPELSTYLDTFQIKMNLRNRAIEDYRKKVAENPDNIDLRELLVQTYFWNGRREEAIKEYLNILVNYAYKSFLGIDGEYSDLLEQIDKTYLYYNYFKKISESVPDRRRKLAELASAYTSSLKKYEKEKEGNTEAAASAKEEFLQSQQSLLEFLTREKGLADEMETRKLQYSEIRNKLPGLQDRGKKEEENFQKATAQIHWEWNRDFFVREFEQVYGREPALAGHVLGRVYQFEGRLQPASQLLGAASKRENPQAATLYALAEDYLWAGDWEKLRQVYTDYGNRITGYAGYSGEIISLFGEMYSPGGDRFISPSEYDRAAEEAQALNDQYPEIKKKADTRLQEIQKDISVLMPLIYDKMKRSFYTLESNTYLIRYELGKYYLTENQLVDATAQFEKVLDIDPWNIDVKFNLGIVRQRYGDWHGAMKNYKEVYSTDPFYPNAAAYYNLLAKQHPDTMNLSTQLLGDTSRISFHGEADFTTPFSTLVSWKGIYAFDSVRLYKPSGTEAPSSHQTHTFSVAVPVNLYFINVTVSPLAGILLTSDLFSDNSLSTSTQPLTPGYFLFMWNVFPVLGGEITLTLPNLNLSGKYCWTPVADTLIPGRTPLTMHTGEVSVNGSLAGTGVRFLKLTTLRGYGKLSFVEDSNIFGTALEEINFGIHLADRPWTNLSVLENLSFEHSKIPSDQVDNGYYAPDGVLVFKGGLSGSTWIALMNDNSLGIQVTALTGGYWEKITADTPDAPGVQIEALARIDLSKGASSYYASLYGSRTWVPSTGELLYWSLTLNFGITGKMLKLLAP